MPWDGECPVLLVIRRGALPDEESCTFTVVNPSVAAVPYHATDGQAPPKLKLRTCLELGGIPLARLRDEAWWVALWFGMNINLSEVASGKLKRGPLKVLYDPNPDPNPNRTLTPTRKRRATAPRSLSRILARRRRPERVFVWGRT